MYFLANEDFSFQEKVFLAKLFFYFVSLEQFSDSIKALMLKIICSYSHLICCYCHLSFIFGKTTAMIYGTISVFYKLNKSAN